MAAAAKQARARARNFYRHVLDEAERADLKQAEKIEGLDMLARAVGTRYRLSPKSRRDLADNLVAVLNSVGDQLLPPEG